MEACKCTLAKDPLYGFTIQRMNPRCSHHGTGEGESMDFTDMEIPKSWIQEDGGLWESNENGGRRVYWFPGIDDIGLEGFFCRAELKAIIKYIEEYGERSEETTTP
jgi:hypothetical protein